MAKSPATHVVIYNQLSGCPGELEPFKDYLSICGCLISLRNNPQQKQPGWPLAPILSLLVNVYGYHVIVKTVSYCCAYGSSCAYGSRRLSNLVTYIAVISWIIAMINFYMWLQWPDSYTVFLGKELGLHHYNSYVKWHVGQTLSMDVPSPSFIPVKYNILNCKVVQQMFKEALRQLKHV